MALTTKYIIDFQHKFWYNLMYKYCVIPYKKID